MERIGGCAVATKVRVGGSVNLDFLELRSRWGRLKKWMILGARQSLAGRDFISLDFDYLLGVFPAVFWEGLGSIVGSQKALCNSQCRANVWSIKRMEPGDVREQPVTVSKPYVKNK